jgi:uncharacterized flavoprotein (TIGR03862 family)
MSATLQAAIVGGGPAGLMAAEVLARAGVPVDLFDAMPSVGRKFLLAGKGGLNLTHSEPMERFATRFGERRASVEPLLQAFPPAALREWAVGLGVQTFVGSSGRVFPRDMKAAPLLRAWLHRLRGMGVRFHMRHRCVGLARDAQGLALLCMDTPQGRIDVPARAVLLALGGASWPKLGSDGAWAHWLAPLGVEVAPLVASNCGFDVGRVDSGGTPSPGWSEYFRSRFAGAPLKTVAIAVRGVDGSSFAQRGEFVVTQTGIEGSLIYAASSRLRTLIEAQGRALLELDLLPDRDAAFVHAEVARPRGCRSLSTHLKSRLHLDGVKAALLRELLPAQTFGDPAALAAAIKSLPVTLVAARPVSEAISTAGGVRFESMSDELMLRAQPGLFCAGEMLDWEAPTGGYLLSACFASGVVAGRGMLRYLGESASKSAGLSSIGAPCGVRSAA